MTPSRARSYGSTRLSDLHLSDQAVLDHVDVLNHLICQHAALTVADDLMDIDHGTSTVVSAEALRLDVGINQAPLSGPVVPHRVLAVQIATFHSVRPVHVWVHRPQSPFDVSIIERLVCF